MFFYCLKKYLHLFSTSLCFVFVFIYNVHVQIPLIQLHLLNSNVGNIERITWTGLYWFCVCVCVCAHSYWADVSSGSRQPSDLANHL